MLYNCPNYFDVVTVSQLIMFAEMGVVAIVENGKLVRLEREE